MREPEVDPVEPLGPIAPIIGFGAYDEVFEMADAIGPASGVFTDRVENVHSFAERVETGSVSLDWGRRTGRSKARSVAAAAGTAASAGSAARLRARSGRR